MGSKSKDITIGIPFFNAAEYLDFAITSVINQTVNNWLLILINDGSTDNSLDIANSYKSDRIIIYNDGQKKGLSNRLNEIASYTQTRFLARMDADDIMHPERIEKQLKYLNATPQIDVVGSAIVSIDSFNNPIGFRNNTIVPKNKFLLLKNRLFYHPTITGKTEWFKRNRYSSEYNRIEDLELWIRTLDNSNFYILNEALLFYREVNIPYLTKYLQTSDSFRKILDNYSEALTITDRGRLFLKSHLKDIVYKLSFFFRLENYLIRARSNSLVEEQMKNFKAVIDYAICKEVINQ